VFKTNGQLLRELIARHEGVLAFGVSSAIEAIVAAKAGHKALYAGGYAAAALRGYPDMGIIGQFEMLQHIQYICEAVPTAQVIADIDDGYGSVHNVRRTVKDLCERTSAAGFHLEDQRYPKRCGHIAGKEILSLEESLGKLAAAIDMRNSIDPERVIIARTDAFSAAGGKKDPSIGGDMQEAVRRGIAYAIAGADLVWCEFPTASRESARAFAEGMASRMPKLGLAFNVSPSFRWDMEKDPMSREELVSMGYKYLFSTYAGLMASMRGVYEAASAFREKDIGGLIELQQRIAGTPTESAMKVVGVDLYQQIERRYSPEAGRRLDSSEGFGG